MANHKPRSYSSDFKAKAVAMVHAGQSQTAVAAELGFPAQNLNRWVRETAGSSPPDVLTLQQRQAFLRQEAAYKRDLARLEAEIVLLKKHPGPACRCPRRTTMHRCPLCFRCSI